MVQHACRAPAWMPRLPLSSPAPGSPPAALLEQVENQGAFVSKRACDCRVRRSPLRYDPPAGITGLRRYKPELPAFALADTLDDGIEVSPEDATPTQNRTS